MNNFLCNNEKGNFCFLTLYASDMYAYKKDKGYPLIICWLMYKKRNVVDTQGCWQIMHLLTWKQTGCRQSVWSQKIHCAWHRKMNMVWTVCEIAECLMWVDKCPAVCSPLIIHCTWHTYKDEHVVDGWWNSRMPHISGQIPSGLFTALDVQRWTCCGRTVK